MSTLGFKKGLPTMKSSDDLFSISTYRQTAEEIQLKIPKTLQFCEPTIDSKKLNQKVLGYGIKTIGYHSSANLKALAYVFLVDCLKNGESSRLKFSLLREISNNMKSYIYLQNLPGPLSTLPKIRIGKLTIELLKNLHSFSEDKNWETKCYEIPKENFILIQFLSIFFRILLFNLKINFAQNYASFLNTSQIFAILTEYFDVLCENRKPFYFFKDLNLFISSPDDKYFSFGKYYPNIKSIADFEEKDDNLASSQEFIQSMIIKEEKIKDSDFIKETAVQSVFNMDAFGNYSFKFQQLPVKESQAYTQAEAERNNKKKENNLKIQSCKTERSSKEKNYFTEKKTKQSRIIDEENDKYSGRTEYFHEQSNKKFLSFSHLCNDSRYETYKGKKTQDLFTRQSIYTCTCNNFKKQKNTIQSNVFEVNLDPPTKPKQKAHLPQFLQERIEKKRQKNKNFNTRSVSPFEKKHQNSRIKIKASQKQLKGYYQLHSPVSRKKFVSTQAIHKNIFKSNIYEMKSKE